MRHGSFFAGAFLLTGVVLSGLSCNQSTNVVTENVIYYYPAKNVYYDSLKSVYYYSLDSAKTWDSIKTRVSSYGTALGPKIAVSRTDGDVWADNGIHRKEYNGVILNLINSQTIALSKVDRINKLRAVVKNETQPEIVEKKEPPREKGLKRFFNKLFGKKKKPASDTTQ